MSDSPRPQFLTGSEVEDFAASYLAQHPHATHADVAGAMRESYPDRPLHNHTLVEVCEQMSPIPELDTGEDARRFLAEMAARYEWVSVFWDRGWGEHGEAAEITVIQGGNGQIPLARVSAEVYRELREAGTIAANSLQTMKARRVHNYVAPAEVSS